MFSQDLRISVSARGEARGRFSTQNFIGVSDDCHRQVLQQLEKSVSIDFVLGTAAWRFAAALTGVMTCEVIASVVDVNYFGRRIDSSELLPLTPAVLRLRYRLIKLMPSHSIGTEQRCNCSVEP